MARNILIIDDEGLVTKSLHKMLAKEGYTAVIAACGKDAIAEYKKSEFDLIVCDVRMPGMDGIETIEEIRRLRDGLGRKNIPEVLITGYADEEKYKNALKLRVADYLFKPFDRNQFLDVIKKNLHADKE
ncbi:MAG: response regulator [Candidatus Omnitrophota bacterium]|jgi:CheY-like chemotaxis protein